MANTINTTTEIDQVFGEFIEGTNIVCTVKEFKRGFRQLKKMITSRNNSVTKKPRKQSNFFKWLNSDDRRLSIKEEYFGDFDAWEDWDENGIIEYYENKNLPIDKLKILIEKKKNDGKEIKKPRIMSLINLKAGLIWSEMSDSEKEEWKDVDNITKDTSDNNDDDSEDVSNDSNEETKTPKASGNRGKKGRPAGYKPKNYTSESSVQQVIENVQTANDEEVELEEFTLDGKNYLKDDNGIVYNMQYQEIGSLKSDTEITFN